MPGAAGAECADVLIHGVPEGERANVGKDEAVVHRLPRMHRVYRPIREHRGHGR